MVIVVSPIHSDASLEIETNQGNDNYIPTNKVEDAITDSENVWYKMYLTKITHKNFINFTQYT